MRIALFAAALAQIAAAELSAQQQPPAPRNPSAPNPEPLYVVDGVILGPATPVSGLSVRDGQSIDPIATHLVPPEAIMAHQSELGIQESQRATIANEVQQAQHKFVDLQWKMSGETERLEKVLQAAPINEAQALEQIDRILAAEREIKRTQIALLIRIKNTLTPEQIAKLAAMRRGQRQE